MRSRKNLHLLVSATLWYRVSARKSRSVDASPSSLVLRPFTAPPDSVILLASLLQSVIHARLPLLCLRASLPSLPHSPITSRGRLRQAACSLSHLSSLTQSRRGTTQSRRSEALPDRRFTRRLHLACSPPSPRGPRFCSRGATPAIFRVQRAFKCGIVGSRFVPRGGHSFGHH